jgi:uncharacterized OB-fold protein
VSETTTEAAAPKEPTRWEPPISDAARPFWDATRERRLALPWCTVCDQPIWYPRAICPRCLGSEAIEWRDASGRATVYAVTVEHSSQTRALEAPYAVALVGLDEGVRLLTNVVGVPADQVAVGDRVQVTWEPLSDGRQLPLFTVSWPTAMPSPSARASGVIEPRAQRSRSAGGSAEPAP